MADKSLFSRLERLFSTNAVIRNVGGNQLKVIDINKIQSFGQLETNSLIDRFNKVYTTTGSALYNLNQTMNYQTLRIQLYSDYEAMDSDAIIASTLDIIADESTLKNESGEVLQIRSSDENVQKILYNLFYDVLNIEFNMWSWIRNMCKYGDFYLKLEIVEKFGVYNVIPYSTYNIIREEGIDPANPSYIRFKYDPNGSAGNNSGYSSATVNPVLNSGEQIYFENYEMAHFRLLSDSNFLPYGRSYIEPARKIWKQLTLMEDAVLIHRIMRAPEKRTFFINVGSIPPAEVDAYMQKTINNMKKTPYVDPQTGEYNLKFNMQNMLEDFYIPVRGNDQATKIDTAKGLEYNGMEDVNYLRDKLFAALKVPKAFMGYEKDLCISPDTLIPLIDGRIVTAQNIINEYNEGKKNYVYSLDEGTKNIVPGEIEWAGFTRMNTQTIKVWLDNGEYIQCTPDHLFMTRDGEWKEAQTLVENESLMPYEWGEKYAYKNHKVVKIELVDELIDTCDLTIKEYHNFGTNAGVIIHNSGKATLAAEDIRFARTIERIQRIMISELTKIALIHLYTQGYDGESLTNFELSLTTPSIIYDQERIALMKEKVDLATNIMNTKLLPTDWVYDHLFHFSQDQYDEFRDLILEDQKRSFRYSQIENEGNDPAESGESYGTPHDLASLYGTGRYGENDVPEGYDSDKMGRPEEKSSIYGTQEDPLGKDRIGRKDMNKTDSEEKNIRTNYKGGSPISLKERTKASYYQNKKSLEGMRKKQLIFENANNSMLDESNIKDVQI